MVFVIGSSPFSPPVEGVIKQMPSTKMIVNNQELGTATLYITEHNVVWGGGVSSNGGPSPTVTLLYPNISLHAIEIDPKVALYMELNYELKVPELTSQQEAGDAGDDDDDDFDADDQPTTEIRFIPEHLPDLQGVYLALNQGQALNPDPTDEVDDDDPYLDGEEFEDGEAFPDEEFEDAEEVAAPPADLMKQMRLDNSNGLDYHDCDDSDE